MLLLHPNEAVSTDRLIDAVWGEEPPASAAGALQVHVHALRKVLGADRIVTRAPGYLIRVEPAEIDASDSRAWSPREPPGPEALALWRGPALADSPTSRSLEPTLLAGGRTACGPERRVAHALDTGRHVVIGRARRARRGAPSSRAVPGAADARALPSRAARPKRSPPTAMRAPLSTTSGSSPPRSSEPSSSGSSARTRSSRTHELTVYDELAPRRDLSGAIWSSPRSKPCSRVTTSAAHADRPRRTGKTSLALAGRGDARRVVADLSSLRDPSLVIQAIGTAFGLGDVSGREPSTSRARARSRAAAGPRRQPRAPAGVVCPIAAAPRARPSLRSSRRVVCRSESE